MSRTASSVDLVIKLEDWKKDKDYDRLGLEEQYIGIPWGIRWSCHSHAHPAGPESGGHLRRLAAVNHRQKKMGYNAAQELYRRVQANINKDNDSEE